MKEKLEMLVAKYRDKLEEEEFTLPVMLFLDLMNDLDRLIGEENASSSS